MPARRPLKSRKTSSTVRGLYEAPPSITFKLILFFLFPSFFSFKESSFILEDGDREADGERKRGKGGKRKICKKKNALV